MNEKNVEIKIDATISVNGVAQPSAIVIVKKTTVTIDELEVVLPNVSVS